MSKRSAADAQRSGGGGLQLTCPQSASTKLRDRPGSPPFLPSVSIFCCMWLPTRAGVGVSASWGPPGLPPSAGTIWHLLSCSEISKVHGHFPLPGSPFLRVTFSHHMRSWTPHASACPESHSSFTSRSLQIASPRQGPPCQTEQKSMERPGEDAGLSPNESSCEGTARYGVRQEPGVPEDKRMGSTLSAED